MTMQRYCDGCGAEADKYAGLYLNAPRTKTKSGLSKHKEHCADLCVSCYKDVFKELKKIVELREGNELF